MSNNSDWNNYFKNKQDIKTWKDIKKSYNMDFDKYKENIVVFPDINENTFIQSSIEFDLYKDNIDKKYNRTFKHFGKPKYPCIVCSKFKDGKSGPAYYHKFNYKIKGKHCDFGCGELVYEFEDNGKTISIPHLCDFYSKNKKILPSPEINEKKDKYPDMGQSKQNIDI